MPSVQETLQSLGFDTNEIKIYTAGLQNGSQTAVDLAEITGIPKLTTHVALESLFNRGLVSCHDHQDERYFSSEHPQKIIGYFESSIKTMEQNIKELTKNIGELEGIMSDEKPSVRFYEGKSGLKQILKERLQMEAKDVKLFSPWQHVQTLFSAKEIEDYRKERQRNGVYYQSIFSSAKKIGATPLPLTDQRIVNQADFPFSSDVAVYNDKVSICSLHGHICGVILESKPIADTFRAIFKMAYETAKRHDFTI